MPKLIGSINNLAASRIYAIEFDSPTNTYFLGGTSDDTDIVSATNTPIVVSFDASIDKFGWRY